MESYIRSFIQGLIPTEEEIEYGKRKMHFVFEKLKKSNGYSIDRARLVGSTYKKTSVRGFIDFDCVIFVNPISKLARNYPDVKVKDVVNNFEDILLMETELSEGDIKKSPDVSDPTTLMFSYENVDFDISIAINWMDPDRRQFGNRASDEQRRGFYDSPNNSGISDYRRSVALVESNIEYAKSKSPFAHEIARLAKFWNKTIQLELKVTKSHVSGRSSIMELIAFSAAEEEESRQSSSSHLNAFKIFLKNMQSMRNIQLYHVGYWKERGIKYQLPRLPYILDPSDPIDNLLKGMKLAIMDAFTEFASVTLKRLEGNDKNGLFDMQPVWYGNGNSWQPKNMLVGIEKSTNDAKLIDYRAGDIDKKKVNTLKKYIAPIVRRECINGSGSSIESRKNSVVNSIRKDIFGNPVSSRSSAGFETHGSRRVTTRIPCGDGNDFVISFDP